MARKTQSGKGRWCRFIVLGIALGIAAPYAKAYVETWLTTIVINAIHYHWQWEQQSQLFKPALQTERL